MYALCVHKSSPFIATDIIVEFPLIVICHYASFSITFHIQTQTTVFAYANIKKMWSVQWGFKK